MYLGVRSVRTAVYIMLFMVLPVVLESGLLRAETDFFLPITYLFLFSLLHLSNSDPNTCGKIVGERNKGALNIFLPFSCFPTGKDAFDANKLYCSEVSAILLQDNDGEAPSRY